MATAQFIHDGKAIDYTPSADVSAGDVVVQNDLVGIATLDITADALGALAVTGVFDLPKATGVGEALAAGAAVYWDAANQQATATADGHTPLGKTVGAAGDDDATGRVALNAGAFGGEVQSAIADLNQTISGTYAQAEVQAISDAVDAILAALRAGNVIADV